MLETQARTSQALIVNLSATHLSLPIYALSPGADTVVKRLSALCDYVPSIWRCCDCGFFRPAQYSAMAWVTQLYIKHRWDIIEPYKAGQISTTDFLNRFVNAFDFLLSDKVEYPRDLITRLYTNRHDFLSLPADITLEQLAGDKRFIAKALLEEAWNSIVAGIDTEHQKKWQHIFQCAREGKHIILISNTNELNMWKILCLLRRTFPGENWSPRIDISVTPDKSPVCILPNISLCLSYRYGTFKVFDSAKKEELVLTGTPALIPLSLEQINTASSGNQVHVTVVSQYAGDLKTANGCVFPNMTIESHHASNYFNSMQPENRPTVNV